MGLLGSADGLRLRGDGCVRECIGEGCLGGGLFG